MSLPSRSGAGNHLRPDLRRKVFACHAEPEQGARSCGLPSPPEGYPDHGRDQGRADNQAGPGEQAAGMADVKDLHGCYVARGRTGQPRAGRYW